MPKTPNIRKSLSNIAPSLRRKGSLPLDKYTDPIKEAQEALKAATLTRKEAERAFKQAQAAENKLHTRIANLQYDQATAKRKEEDLRGVHGVVFTMSLVPKDLFTKRDTRKFVLTQGQWLMGNKVMGHGARFWAREVGSLYGGGLYCDVHPGYFTGRFHSSGQDWMLTREEFRAALNRALLRDQLPGTDGGVALNAYSALEYLKGAA